MDPDLTFHCKSGRIRHFYAEPGPHQGDANLQH
jgi:hypothetical protein